MLPVFRSERWTTTIATGEAKAVLDRHRTEPARRKSAQYGQICSGLNYKVATAQLLPRSSYRMGLDPKAPLSFQVHPSKCLCSFYARRYRLRSPLWVCCCSVHEVTNQFGRCRAKIVPWRQHLQRLSLFPSRASAFGPSPSHFRPNYERAFDDFSRGWQYTRT